MDGKTCKYCQKKLEWCIAEGLTCNKCIKSIHLNCLNRGLVPGGLIGDVFFLFTCKECSTSNEEVFIREKLSWVQVVILVFYHMQAKNPGLARKGYFHWRNHITSFIDKNWNVIFRKDFKKKKSIHGTVAGVLSSFSAFFFQSGTTLFNEPAWWTLTYPKLSPGAVTHLHTLFSIRKQKAKHEKNLVADSDLFQQVLQENVQNKDLLTRFVLLDPASGIQDSQEEQINQPEPSNETAKKFSTNKSTVHNKKRSLLPTFENTCKKLLKRPKSTAMSYDIALNLNENEDQSVNYNFEANNQAGLGSNYQQKEPLRLLNPLCHFNTSLNNISRMKGQQMQIKLLGGVRKDLILSPYSGAYLKPYIRRDTETFPNWLKMMAELQIKANRNVENYVLPPRGPIDYTYVHPEHIPAINSLCNQFFWTGIDLTDCLQYPDFSCVVLYKKLIIGFAFIVPDVKFTENYMSFLFTRPGWRNCGIAKFMIYHLIQTSLGKDITLHVSVNNSAIFLYQKFGFKVESVDLNFYDKYYRSDAKESKHAFFCRLER